MLVLSDIDLLQSIYVCVADILFTRCLLQIYWVSLTLNKSCCICTWFHWWAATVSVPVRLELSLSVISFCTDRKFWGKTVMNSSWLNFQGNNLTASWMNVSFSMCLWLKTCRNLKTIGYYNNKTINLFKDKYSSSSSKRLKNDNIAFLNDSTWLFFVRFSFAMCFCICARQRWSTYCVSSQILWIPSMIISYSSVVQRQLNNTRLLKLRAQRGATGQEILFVCCICWSRFTRAHIQKYFNIFTSAKFIKVFLHSQ